MLVQYDTELRTRYVHTWYVLLGNDFWVVHNSYFFLRKSYQVSLSTISSLNNREIAHTLKRVKNEVL